MKTAAEWVKTLEDGITAGPIFGDRKNIYTQGVAEAALLRDKLGWGDEDRVCEIGCGNGRLAIGLLTVSPGASYAGVEIIEKCVEFCQGAFKGESEKFKFIHLDVYNERYNPKGVIQPNYVVYPFPDGSFDQVWFSSVFTHVARIDEVGRMLSEAGRILKERGVCYATFFLSPPNEVSNKAARSCFPRQEVVDLISNFYRIDDVWLGKTNSWNDQTRFKLVKEE